MVELAICATLLIVIAFGIVEFGNAWNRKLEVETAVACRRPRRQQPRQRPHRRQGPAAGHDLGAQRHRLSTT